MTCMTALLAGCQSAPDMNVEQQVDELYQKMPQEERIAQLKSMYMEELFDEQGQLDTVKCRELIPFGIGHFSQYAFQKPRDPNVVRDMVAAVQQWLMEKTPNGIPALFHEEVLSGVNTQGSTIYPQQIGQACSFNPELAELKTRQTADQMRKMGGILSLSPMVDVCRNPSFNRLEESYADEKELMEEILLPHETMIRVAGSRAVMPGYHAMKGNKQTCVADSTILNEILRGYLGFDGMVVSDYTAIDQLPAPVGFPDGEKGWDTMQKAAAAINGGNDVDFPFGANYQYLQEALDSGLVAPQAFERAVKDVLRYKFRAGLFDEKPYLYSTEKIVLDTPEERKTAYDIATQSVVLLQNDSNLLPLTSHLSPLASHPSPLKILVTGPNANSMWAMCGDYSFPSMTFFWKKMEEDLDHPHVITLLEGLQNHKPDSIDILYSRGCDWTEEIETKFSHVGDKRSWEYPLLHRKVNSGETANKEETLAMADSADVIIAAMGENVMLCGENRDRQGLRLPGKQQEYVEALLATGKPVVLVLFGGRAQVIGDLAERCAAVIQAWYPGEEGGNAVADILYGIVSPSAKLSVCYPKEEIYEPICYNYPLTSHPSPLTSQIQWPFGYGLTYTTFEYKHLLMDQSARVSTDYVKVQFEVKNTGKVAATEIAQVYLSPTAADQPLKPIQLQGFARVELEPGQTKRVEMKLYTDQFGYYTHEGQRQWNIQPGTYTVKVGASSADIRLEQEITLKGEKITKPLRDRYFSEVEVTD